MVSDTLLTMIRRRPDDAAGGEPTEVLDPPAEATPETPAVAEAPASWQGPSQEEWERTQQYIAFMAQQFLPDDDEPEVEPQAADLVNQFRGYVDQRLAPMAEEQGKRKMQELFSVHEKSFGEFDHTLAERAAESLLRQIGDPVKAVEEGAKYAAAIRKQEREAGIEAYKASLQGGGGDEPGGEGAGEHSAAKLKSYDDVIEKWTSQNEV